MKRKVVIRLLAVLTGGAVTACVSVGYFKDATASKVAQLEIVMADEPNSFWIFRNGIDCSGGFDVLGKERTADAIAGTAPPLVIEAEKEFAVYADLRKKSPLRYCDLMVSFFPEPGGRYRMRLKKKESNCGIKLTRFIEEGGARREIIEPSYKRRIEKRGAISVQCVPL